MIRERLQDEQERVLVQLSFELGLTPVQILRDRPDLFSDLAEVRRIKERVLKRLKNDSELRLWLV